MIRQICLSCYKTVELPDDAAGKDAPCPNCGKTISVPAKYAAEVAEGGGVTASPPPAPKPAADPYAPPGLRSEAAPPTPPPPAGAPTHGFGFAIDPKWLDWVPLACVAVAFVLTFFSWVEMKLGGYTVMSQNGWEAMFAGKGNYTPKGAQWEMLDKGLAGKAEDERTNAAKLPSDWLLLVPYVLLLIVLLLLLVAERVVRDPATFPATAKLTFLPPLWKWRWVAFGGLAVLAFLLLWVQSFQGFGLQRAIKNFAYYEYNKKLADGPTDSEKRELAIQGGQVAGGFGVQQTLSLNLLLTLHAVAVLALAARFWIASRGPTKPLPRLDIRW